MGIMETKRKTTIWGLGFRPFRGGFFEYIEGPDLRNPLKRCRLRDPPPTLY